MGFKKLYINLQVKVIINKTISYEKKYLRRMYERLPPLRNLANEGSVQYW